MNTRGRDACNSRSSIRCSASILGNSPKLIKSKYSLFSLIGKDANDYEVFGAHDPMERDVSEGQNEGQESEWIPLAMDEMSQSSLGFLQAEPVSVTRQKENETRSSRS